MPAKTANNPLGSPLPNWIMPGFYPYVNKGGMISRSTVDFYTGTAQADPGQAIRAAINELQSALVHAQLPTVVGNVQSVFIFYVETKDQGGLFIATVGYAFSPADLMSGDDKNPLPDSDGMLSLVNLI